MADVIVLKDGSIETILNSNDFEQLVEKHMGDDSKDYIKTMMEELQYEAEDNDPDGYLLSLESSNTCLMEILETMEKMKELLAAPRMNRNKMSKLVEQVQRQINNQI